MFPVFSLSFWGDVVVGSDGVDVGRGLHTFQVSVVGACAKPGSGDGLDAGVTVFDGLLAFHTVSSLGAALLIGDAPPLCREGSLAGARRN